MKQRDCGSVIEISRPFAEKYGDPYFPYNEDSLRRTFFHLLQNAPYFRLLELEGKPVAWMAAHAQSPHGYSFKRCLTQAFLHSSSKGRQGVYVLKALHEDLCNYAKYTDYNVVCSSSFLPNKDTFYRILEKEGWRITPVGALRKV